MVEGRELQLLHISREVTLRDEFSLHGNFGLSMIMGIETVIFCMVMMLVFKVGMDSFWVKLEMQPFLSLRMSNARNETQIDKFSNFCFNFK